ncbi:MAG: transketolase family protein [Lentimicrobium sp.]|nr:transketolase family protein [Lentimicrobium sp.]
MDEIIRDLIPTKTGFSEGVLIAGAQNDSVVVLGSDITTSVGLNLFANKYPEKFISLGIAEQNAVGIAAGLALTGKIPVFATYAVFSALRTTDQIRISVCYNNLHVIIGGAHAGISVGPDGATHQALEDIAVMRSLPNMTVLSPCDATQARILTIKAIMECRGPVYIRFGREAVPDFTDENLKNSIGKAQVLQDGRQASIIATGHMVWMALKAARILKLEGIDVRVINMHTIKPIDIECIVSAARETGYLLSVEEHQIYGGLGSAIAEVVVKHYPVPMDMIGMNDCFGESGKPEELLEKYGLTANAIVTRLKNLIHSFPR